MTSRTAIAECVCEECAACQGHGVVLLAAAGEIIAATCKPCGGTGTFSGDCPACRKPEVIPSASVRVEGKTVIRTRRATSPRKGGLWAHGEGSKGNRTTEYRTWANMHDRTMNPKNPAYKHYGGRGITICERWHDYLLFLEDMGRKPSSGYSIERVNNSGDYEPGNCVWATESEQSKNKRNNHWIEFNGKRQVLADWVRETGLTGDTIRTRLKKGWPVEQALTIPPGQSIEIPDVHVQKNYKTVLLLTEGKPYMQCRVDDEESLTLMHDVCSELGHDSASKSLFALLQATSGSISTPVTAVEYAQQIPCPYCLGRSRLNNYQTTSRLKDICPRCDGRGTVPAQIREGTQLRRAL